MSRLSFYSKKTVAWICAIALVVAGITAFTPKTVSAAEITSDGVTYTLDNCTGNYVGFVLQGAFGQYFGCAWSGATTAASATASVTVEADGEVVLDLGTKGNGAGLYVSELSSLPEGTYTLKYTGTGDFTSQVQTMTLTISGGGAAEPTVPDAPVGLVANINDLETNYTIAFAPSNGATSYKFYLDGTFVKDITNGGIVTFVELGLQPGTTYAFGVSAVNAAGESNVTSIQVTTPGTNSGVEVSADVAINGFQMSTNTLTVGGSTYDGGVRTIYSVEPTVDGQNVAEVGLVYGVTAKITDADMVIDSESEYVASAVATAAGKLSKVYGTSTTATYYAMTMADDLANASVAELQGSYSVRAYAKLADGTYVYSDVATFSKYGVASYLYDNALFSTFTAHAYVYDNVLSRVNASYPEVDYVWSQTIVKPNDLED